VSFPPSSSVGSRLLSIPEDTPFIERTKLLFSRGPVLSAGSFFSIAPHPTVGIPFYFFDRELAVVPNVWPLIKKKPVGSQVVPPYRPDLRQHAVPVPDATLVIIRESGAHPHACLCYTRLTGVVADASPLHTYLTTFHFAVSATAFPLPLCSLPWPKSRQFLSVLFRGPFERSAPPVSCRQQCIRARTYRYELPNFLLARI